MALTLGRPASLWVSLRLRVNSMVSELRNVGTFGTVVGLSNCYVIFYAMQCPEVHLA